MSWSSPLIGYENAEPLPDKVNADGKSLYNPPAPLSTAYEEFPKPIDSSNNAFDFHGMSTTSLQGGLEFDSKIVYYMQSDAEQLKFARELHERVRREFPEVCHMCNICSYALGSNFVLHSYVSINSGKNLLVSTVNHSFRDTLSSVRLPGPHPTAMFEINTFTPHQTGALFGWLVVNRGPCS
jgi:hypothetical protein